MTSFILSFLPIVTLLIGLLIIKLPAKKASLIAFTVAVIEFFLWTKPGLYGAVITLEKGLAMSVFVGLIACSAMLLYNLVDKSGGFTVINHYLSGIFSDRLAMFLMISWVFSAFLQGIAGYGLPAVIATTILMKSGFPAAKAAAASLLGHSWAISFGSMGSSIYAIDLVTGTPLGEILKMMARYGVVSVFCCGVGICFIYGGFSSAVKGLKYVIPTTAVMSVSLIVMAQYEMVSVIGFVTGLFGIITMMVVYKVTAKEKAAAVSKKEKRDLLDSVLPYILVILLSIGFFLADPGIKLTFSFPGYETLQGMAVEAKEDYVVFNIFKYPFTIILLTTIISVVYYSSIHRMQIGQLKEIGQATAKKIVPTLITLLFLLCTASIMMDSGMTTILSTTIVDTTGRGYSFMASMIGLIGTFITGTNTNSNILFGSLQETAALTLRLAPAMMCAVQSITASVGGAIGPTNTALVAATSELTGKESEIYRYTIPATVIIAMVLGTVNAVCIH